MEFWGAEIKSGGSLKVNPGRGKMLHLSQVCIGEIKKDKGNDYIRLYVHKNGQKFIAGMLSLERIPQVTLDLIFEDEFELSHDLKQGSVHVIGYRVDDSKSDEDVSEDDLEELVPIDALNNGKPEANDLKPSGSKPNAGLKPEKAEGTSKVKIVEPSKDAKKNVEDDETEDDEDDDEDDESVEDEGEADEEMASSDAESDEEDDSDEEEDSDEETPKKPEPAKKRPGESTSKTPVPEKKAKFSTPQQKTEGKKVSGHVATPHPAKQTGKTPAVADKSNKQTPSKSFVCPSCSKSFGSEQAVQSHSKAKHGGN
ncbi:histone deacetylase HDT1-like isoform X2 [Chenopodium quinoa]|uniref:histone deacetylase HDT1-like isoform X2 n=1 Tax=Chenopodium quinoa TaxID=63459 RepID=UPI000B77EDF7|nr:histone deacetylase HDT1-like isoform X2 [Chenopodium quinoa]